MQITQTLANELKTQALSGQVDKIGMKTDMIIRIVTKPNWLPWIRPGTFRTRSSIQCIRLASWAQLLYFMGVALKPNSRRKAGGRQTLPLFAPGSAPNRNGTLSA